MNNQVVKLTAVCVGSTVYLVGSNGPDFHPPAPSPAIGETIRILHEVAEVPPSVAYLYLSAATDFVVSQVVDDVKGVHCRIRKADFAPWH